MLKIQIHLSVLSLALAASCTYASESSSTQEYTLGIHTLSVHSSSGKQSPASRGWNNYNYGAYLILPNHIVLGGYKNSLFRDSYYIGYNLTSPSYTPAHISFNLTLGVVSGYDKVVSSGGDHTDTRCESKCKFVNLKSIYSPLIVPSISIPLTQNLSGRFSLICAPSAPMAIHMSVEYRFKL